MAVRSSVGDQCAVAVATGFYLSYIPVKLAGGRTWWTGSGLLGTAQGLALAPMIPRSGPFAAIFLTAAIALSSWICGIAERVLNHHDDQRIILDEIVGFWTAIIFLPRTPFLLVSAFVLFRFFDATKLPPVNWLARLPGGAGVVADDIGAGIITNLLIHGAIILWPQILTW